MSQFYRTRRKSRRGKKKFRGSGVFVNRRNPKSRFVSIEDVWLNLKERVYCWWHRVPEGSYINWDKNGKIKGHTSKAKRPWF